MQQNRRWEATRQCVAPATVVFFSFILVLQPKSKAAAHFVFSFFDGARPATRKAAATVRSTSSNRPFLRQQWAHQRFSSSSRATQAA
ncbi:hypothetical protein MRB53_017004 [Persea americana]|uniref:Uncharacterized protein n=1 Tax=Persea americana TaxID=3435 RepID=A0ACC2M3U9_PERAE|nr:hypothetical protein MRB53_017004 [Persea americana]